MTEIVTLVADKTVIDWGLRFDRFIAVGQWVIGLSISAITTVAGVAIWSYKTSESAALSRQDIREIQDWRAKKDITEARILALQEQQAKLMDRLTDISLRQR